MEVDEGAVKLFCTGYDFVALLTMCFRPSTQSMASAAPRHWFQPHELPLTQSMPRRWNLVVTNQWKPTRRDQLDSQQCVPAFAIKQSSGAKSSPNDAGTDLGGHQNFTARSC